MRVKNSKIYGGGMIDMYNIYPCLGQYKRRMNPDKYKDYNRKKEEKRKSQEAGTVYFTSFIMLKCRVQLFCKIVDKSMMLLRRYEIIQNLRCQLFNAAAFSR